MGKGYGFMRFTAKLKGDYAITQGSQLSGSVSKWRCF